MGASGEGHTSAADDDRTGTVVAVCTAAEGEPWKTPVPDGAVVESYGLAGDRHAGATRASHGRPGATKPNDRQVAVVAHEVITDVSRELAI